jgi:hypothetical protein
MADFVSAQKIREETIGTEHPAYATILCNLGVLYSLKRNYAYAGN